MSKLYRSRRDKKITGLCGGLAETLNVDATLLRLLLVITTLFSGGTVIFIYVLAAIVIPKEPGFEPPYDPYAGPYGRPPYNGGGWNPPPRPQSGPARPDPYAGAYEANKGSHIDEMMKDIEKKALQREIEELRKKVAHYENNNDKSKGDV
ncbi:PspC domain-containing protein [Paenibacillus athensensis]|uniref:Phage shock protein PspC N-terminal domain-containing protein n=1 Tax=Paenibacillus athensensis TaxID=1967502 RepID=A0A4Y8Q4S5_9BACL|nr:PspC domain-containing protein [Paenibacillus athensensis]MCD1258713.1 PspC domain-containing protein [Paenibacillus athensensis]